MNVQLKTIYESRLSIVMHKIFGWHIQCIMIQNIIIFIVFGTTLDFELYYKSTKVYSFDSFIVLTR